MSGFPPLDKSAVTRRFLSPSASSTVPSTTNTPYRNNSSGSVARTMSRYYRPSSPDEILSDEANTNFANSTASTGAVLSGFEIPGATTTPFFDQNGARHHPWPRDEASLWGNEPFYHRPTQVLSLAPENPVHSPSPSLLCSSPPGTWEHEVDPGLAASLHVETGSSPPSKPDSKWSTINDDSAEDFVMASTETTTTNDPWKQSMGHGVQPGHNPTGERERRNRKRSTTGYTYLEPFFGSGRSAAHDPFPPFDPALPNPRPPAISDEDLRDCTDSSLDGQSQVGDGFVHVPPFYGDSRDGCDR